MDIGFFTKLWIWGKGNIGWFGEVLQVATHPKKPSNFFSSWPTQDSVLVRTQTVHGRPCRGGIAATPEGGSSDCFFHREKNWITLPVFYLVGCSTFAPTYWNAHPLPWEAVMAVMWIKCLIWSNLLFTWAHEDKRALCPSSQVLSLTAQHLPLLCPYAKYRKGLSKGGKHHRWTSMGTSG